MNTKHILKYKNTILRPLRQEDIETLRLIRNNSDTSKYLTQVGDISQSQQKEWYKRVINDDNEIIFAITELNNCDEIVGTCSMYNFDKNKAEFGKIMVNPRCRGRKIGLNAMISILHYSFCILGMSDITAEVNSNNIASKKNMLNVGFNIVKDNKQSNSIELKLTRDSFYKNIDVSSLTINEV